MRSVIIALLVCASSSIGWGAPEICGNDTDDDGNGMVDEGCAPALSTGICESPLSCGDTGMVSWSSGALHYDLEPDFSPRVPFGPGIGFRRFYTSAYAPGAGPASVNHTPLGARWQHTYMSWIDRFSVGASSAVILHTSEGQDVYATLTTTSGGWETYSPQAGFHVMSIKRNTASPNQYQVQLLTGETLYYNNIGQLTQIWDALVPTPNKILIAWTGTTSGNVATVTDASGHRRLLFNYTGSLLTSINYQLLVTGSWVTQQTTTYTFSGGSLAYVTRGAVLAQHYLYAAGYLSTIMDSAGATIAAFSYNASAAAQVDKIVTPSGSLGFEFASMRSSCTGGTMLYFNRASAGGCTTDADCSGGHGFCGGKTGAGATGTCFAAARCLALATVNGERVVTTVTTPNHSDGSACTGACADVARYVWSTAANLVNVTGTQDPLGAYTAVAYNTNGLPTQIGTADNDADPTNGGYARTTWISYDTTFPGRIAESRHRSDLDPSASSCSATVTTGCVRDVYTYGSDGNLQTRAVYGATLGPSGAIIPYAYAVTYSHDSLGRLTQVDGPVAGMKTTHSYFSSADARLDGFLQTTSQYADATRHLDTNLLSYDLWGNATGRRDPDGTVSCREFDPSINFLTKIREAMAGQSDCSVTNPADITHSWFRDSQGRELQEVKPDGSCEFHIYNTDGTLARIKRRDDCNVTSAGEDQQFLYTTDAQLSEVDYYNSSGTLTYKEPKGYYDSRKLNSRINPVDGISSDQIQYNVRGDVTETDAAGGLGKRVYNIDLDHRVLAENRYKTGTTFDSWTFTHSWNNDQSAYTDGDAKTTQSQLDDLGRMVKAYSPDQSYPTLLTYDAANRMTAKTEAFGGAGLVHNFTYDGIGRLLNSDYAGTCPTGTPRPEIQRSYDVLPSGVSCLGTGGCTNTAGHLSYVRTTLMCSSAYASSDGALDQETFYSYDAAGRMVDEYVRDDTGHKGESQFAWTANGVLNQYISPSGTKTTWNFGGASNSDTDQVTSLVQGSTVADNITWAPFGSLTGYRQSNSIGGVQLSTSVSRNLAYRVSDIRVSAGAVEKDGVAINEDAKGRVTKRDFFDVKLDDSYFVYDLEDRILCETKSLAATCPTTATVNVKESRTASPYFTNAGDWTSIMRTVRGALHNDTFTLNPGTHQIAQIQTDAVGSALGHISYAYNALGDRASDSGSGADETHTARTYTYDQRHNLINVRGQYIFSHALVGGTWTLTWHYYDLGSTYDNLNRRVSKTFYDEATGTSSQYFFFYDTRRRLTEIEYTPDSTTPTVRSLFNVAWLGGRPVMFTQTDYPSGVVSKRYTVTDESDRIIALWSWPARGDATKVWQVNPDAWGSESQPTLGASIFQPFVFQGQYRDWETAAAADIASNLTAFHEPPLCLNGRRTYDPEIGGYLQLDPLLPQTRSAYVYVESNPVAKSDPSGLIYQFCEAHNAGHTQVFDPQTGLTMDSGETIAVSCTDSNGPPPPNFTELPDVPTHDGPGGGMGGGTSVSKPASQWRDEIHHVTRPFSPECKQLVKIATVAGQRCMESASNGMLDDCYCGFADQPKALVASGVTSDQCYHLQLQHQSCDLKVCLESQDAWDAAWHGGCLAECQNWYEC